MAENLKKTETQVVMARSVASRWVRRVAKAEYRVRIMFGSKDLRNLPNLLRSFRDGKVAIKGLSPIGDLGVREDFDALEVWSGDHDAMSLLSKWAEARGFETSGVW